MVIPGPPSHRLAKTSSTNNSQDYHHDDNDDHRTFILTNNAKRSQTRNLNLFKMLGSKRVIRSQFPIWLRVKCSDPGEWVSNSTKVPFISFLSSAKHCKFATNVSLVLFQLWLIHFLMISPSRNIFWKENNVGSLQPAKTSWWIANAKMIICELKKNAKSHTICIKALVSSIGCYFDCEAVDCSHSAEFSGWTYWLPPTDCPQWIGRDCHKTLKHVQGCSRNIRF